VKKRWIRRKVQGSKTLDKLGFKYYVCGGLSKNLLTNTTLDFEPEQRVKGVDPYLDTTTAFWVTVGIQTGNAVSRDLHMVSGSPKPFKDSVIPGTANDTPRLYSKPSRESTRKGWRKQEDR
jgi:hypothetical protein